MSARNTRDATARATASREERSGKISRIERDATKTRTRVAQARKRARVSFAKEPVTIGFADDDASRAPWELPRTCDSCGLYCLPGDERWACAMCEREGREFDLCGACGRSARAREAHACGGMGIVLAEMRDRELDELNEGVGARGGAGGGKGEKRRR